VSARELGARELGALPTRSFWLVVHRTKRSLPKVRAVSEWLSEAFATETPMPRRRTP
jgi:DNA-binding transcriptional LysR family regulator